MIFMSSESLPEKRGLTSGTPPLLDILTVIDEWSNIRHDITHGQVKGENHPESAH
jgi:hypothetical protein